MGINPVMVLLVGEGARNSLQLLQWLNHRGCSCEVAQSCQDACNLVSRTQFDLVLSQYQLPDRTAFPLLDGLAGSPATLFFSTRVENGSLWLKMLERGKRCIGAPVLQSNALTDALARVLDAAPESREKEAVTSEGNLNSSSAEGRPLYDNFQVKKRGSSEGLSGQVLWVNRKSPIPH
jgi:CheY-like chemotaxis protein